MIKVIPNKKDIGAEIICDLRKLSKDDLKRLKSALYKYGVIFFKKQKYIFLYDMILVLFIY